MLDILIHAAKNLFYYRGKSLFIGFLYCFSVLIILVVTTLLAAVSNSWKDAVVLGDLADIQVMRPAFFEDIASLPLEHALEEHEAISARILEAEPQIRITQRISFAGLLAGPSGSSPFLGRAVNPAGVEAVLPRIFSNLIEGEPLGGEARGEGVIGEGLAKNLKIGIGDEVIMAVYDKDKELSAGKLLIRGILKIPDEYANNRFLISDFDTVSRLCGVGGAPTELLLRAGGGDKDDERLQRLNELFPDHEVSFHSWLELAGSFKQTAGFFSFLSFTIALLVGFLAFFSIANTVVSWIFDRLDELSILRSMGMGKRAIAGLILAENLGLCLLGSLAGLALFALLLLPLRDGIAMPPPPGAIEAVTIFPVWDGARVIALMFFLLLIAMSSSLFPILTSLRLDIVKTLNRS